MALTLLDRRLRRTVIIMVVNHIYAEVAHQLDRELSAVSRQIERIGNLCWEHLDVEGKRKYIGRQLKDSTR